MKNKQYRAMQQMRRFGEQNCGKIPHTKVRSGEEEFDSIAEHDRWLELMVLQRAGAIRDLECHPRYEVLPAQRTPQGRQNFKPVVYTPDFRYTDAATGRLVVEEVKSEYTRHEPAYVIRRKLLYYTHGIYVEEIVR